MVGVAHPSVLPGVPTRPTPRLVLRSKSVLAAGERALDLRLGVLVRSGVRDDEPLDETKRFKRALPLLVFRFLALSDVASE